MADDSLRDYLVQHSPWLALHDLNQEMQEIRALVEEMRAQQARADQEGQDSQVSEMNWNILSRRLEGFEKRAGDLQRWMNHLFSVEISRQTVLLADARHVERLNQDERIAGVLLALCTLVLGALLQNVVSSQATVVAVFTALCFGGLAALFYRRSWRAWQELNTERRFQIWPPSEGMEREVS